MSKSELSNVSQIYETLVGLSAIYSHAAEIERDDAVKRAWSAAAASAMEQLSAMYDLLDPLAETTLGTGLDHLGQRIKTVNEAMNGWVAAHRCVQCGMAFEKRIAKVLSGLESTDNVRLIPHLKSLHSLLEGTEQRIRLIEAGLKQIHQKAGTWDHSYSKVFSL